jgi:hypothetical protein
MILYKYIPFDSGMKIIKSGKIGFSQPQYFNDPFDIPSYPTNNNVSAIEAVFEQLRVWGKEHIWAENSGALSMTRTPTNKLMWAHYADMHQGMVIGINVQEAGFTNKETNFIPAQFGDIKYVSERPTGEFVTQVREGMVVGATHHFMADHYEKTSSVFLHKSIEWSYEEEVRVVKCLKGIEGGSAVTESGSFEVIKINERPLYLYDMGQASIEEVYLGGRCQEKNQTAAIDLIKKTSPAAIVRKAKINKNRFGLEFRQIGEPK